MTHEDQFEPCKHCAGTGMVKRTGTVAPWRTWQERVALAKQAEPGDRWVQIKSGRIVEVVAGLEHSKWRDSLKLKHENGRTTMKWTNYFGQEYTPETPPE